MQCGLDCFNPMVERLAKMDGTQACRILTHTELLLFFPPPTLGKAMFCLVQKQMFSDLSTKIQRKCSFELFVGAKMAKDVMRGFLRFRKSGRDLGLRLIHVGG